MKKYTVLVCIFASLFISFMSVCPDDVAYAGTYPPGISFSSLLNGFQVQPKDGRILLNNVQGTFFPGPDTKGWTIIRKEGGADVYRMDFNVEALESPYYLLNYNGFTDLKSGGKLNSMSECKLTEPGRYALHFCIDGREFYRFPFELTTLSGGGPYSGGSALFLEGDWSRWAYLLYSGADPRQNIIWKIWLRHKGVEREKDAKVGIEVTRDGKLIATGPQGTSYTFNQKWIRYSFDLIHPMKGTSGGALMKASELLAVDGSYVLKMKINGALYGAWNFKVEGGQLNYAGRTVRGKADSFTFIDGGKDAWWYEKQ